MGGGLWITESVLMLIFLSLSYHRSDDSTGQQDLGFICLMFTFESSDLRVTLHTMIVILLLDVGLYSNAVQHFSRSD